MTNKDRYDTTGSVEDQYEPGSRNRVLRNLQGIRSKREMDRREAVLQYEALAVTHAELVLIHPFREGNGRLARMVSVLMAFQAGLPALDFSGLKGKKRQEYFAAVRSGLRKDYGPMCRVFQAIVEKTLRGRSKSA